MTVQPTPTLSTPLNREFVNLVGKDVRGDVDAQIHEWLHSEKMVETRYAALIALKRDLESQLAGWQTKAARKRGELQLAGDDGTEWVAWKAENLDWRSRAIWFLNAVEDHISAAKIARREQRMKHRDGDAKLLTELVNSIAEHEKVIDDTASEEDERIWALARQVKESFQQAV